MKNWFDKHYLKILIGLILFPVLLLVLFVKNVLDSSLVSTEVILSLVILSIVLLVCLGIYMLYGFMKWRKYKAGLIFSAGTVFVLLAFIGISVGYGEYEKRFQPTLEAARNGNADALLRLADARGKGVLHDSLLMIISSGQPVKRFGEARPLLANEITEINALIDGIVQRAGNGSSIDNCLAASLYLHGLNTATESLDTVYSFDEKRVLALKEASVFIFASQATGRFAEHEELCSSSMVAFNISNLVESLKSLPDLEQYFGKNTEVGILKEKLLMFSTSQYVEQPQTPTKAHPAAQPPISGNCSEGDERVGLCRRSAP